MARAGEAGGGVSPLAKNSEGEGPSTLACKLERRILENGPISVAGFMEACLLDPEFGYYRRHLPIGRGGDFITSPEVSQMFGELIGLWCVEVWRAMGAPSPFKLIELGPGRGTLMADALRAARVEPDFQRALSLHLVEACVPLARLQAECLKPFGIGVTWHETLDELPPAPALVIANEFIDCLPTRQFMRRGDAWYERCIGLDDAGGLAFGVSPSPILDGSGQKIRALRLGASHGDIFETRPLAERLAASLGDRAARHLLAALIIDYGHVTSAPGDTLQAVRSHRYADPLAAPGEADLTAHVDFAALARAATAHGLDVWGPLSQRGFLLALGLAKRAERLLADANAEQAKAVVSGARRLVGREQMGEIFKVIALTSPGLTAPPGLDGQGIVPNLSQ